MEAVKAGRVDEVRAYIIDGLGRHADRTSTLEMVKYAVVNTPDIFDEDEEEFYSLPKDEWNAAYADTLRRELKTGFTRDRVMLYADVEMYLASHPEARQRVPVEAILSVSEVLDESDYVEEDRIAIESVEIIEKATEDTGEHPSVAKIIGYIILIAGLVVSIVGLCIPLNFLVGLGIGVIMIGSAVVYLALK